MKAEKAIKEFAKKVSVKATFAGAIGIDNNWLVEPLTALISEHYYPKEFVLWLVIQDYWGMDILTCKWTNDEPTAFQEEKTTDELYEYWKENER